MSTVLMWGSLGEDALVWRDHDTLHGNDSLPACLLISFIPPLMPSVLVIYSGFISAHLEHLSQDSCDSVSSEESLWNVSGLMA